MGYRAEPEKLIRMYEKMLPLWHGNAGTTCFAPLVYFRRAGFQTEVTLRREEFDEKARQADVCILFFRWRRKWKLGAHFVALQHTDSGFIGYNTYLNSKGADRYGESLAAFLQRKGYFGSILMTIQEEKHEK